jgi:hypothetical protein
LPEAIRRLGSTCTSLAQLGMLPRQIVELGCGRAVQRDRDALPVLPAGPLELGAYGILAPVVVRFFPGIGQALPGGFYFPRQRYGRCSQHRRSSPVSGLNGPLGLTLAPNDGLIAVNGSNGSAVGITPSGRQTAKVRLVRRGAGPVFGVTPQAGGHGLLFVNGGVNALDLLSP